MLPHLESGRCRRLCGPPGSWQQGGCLGPGVGDGRKGPEELRHTARLLLPPLRPAALKSHPERPAEMPLGWTRISDSCRKRHHPRDSPQYLKKQEATLRLGVRAQTCTLCVCERGILTWRVALVETGGDLSQSVSARRGGGRKKGTEALSGLLLLQVPGSHLLADAGFQQAVGRNGAVPQESVQTGLHWKHHPLKERLKR